jgi:hypothetical protein
MADLGRDPRATLFRGLHGPLIPELGELGIDGSAIGATKYLGSPDSSATSFPTKAYIQ